MNSKIIKVVTILLSVFIALYALVQIVLFFYSPYEAQTVYQTTINNSVRTQCLVMRNEKVLSQQKEGVIDYQVENGGKVAQDSVIANQYVSEADMTAQKKIESISKEIAVLQAAQQKGTTAAATIDSITAQINNSYLELMEQLNERDYADITDYRLKLQEQICKKQIVIGKQGDFNARIKELQQEQKSLEGSIKVKPTQIKSKHSGYFAQHVDGLEEQYGTAFADDLTVDSLQTLLKAQTEEATAPATDRLGKIIESFEWKIALTVDLATAPSVKDGKTLNLVFPEYGETTYPVVVERSELDKENQKKLVILSCNVMDNNITKMRFEEAELIISQITGIQVPKKAVRYEENEMGVYEKIGQKLYFRKIDKLYETDEYIISKSYDETDTKHEYVRVYDDVIVKGKELYDKKPIG